LIQNTKAEITKAGVHSLEAVRSCPQRLVALSPEVEEERRQAKAFLYGTLYYSPTLDREKEDAEQIIRQLFEFWMAKPEQLPSSYQESANHTPLPRVICDYIAGMTDNFIYEQYEKYREKQ
jgi:dGTPase